MGPVPFARRRRAQTNWLFDRRSHWTRTVSDSDLVWPFPSSAVMVYVVVLAGVISRQFR